ncbi:MAG: ATP-dependent zinc metalloprotease FtsH [Ruminiclostridium sp.]|nr:ATP-dependent zinc metalloprotease FtsH [Ruminiclostridium sp.]
MKPNKAKGALIYLAIIAVLIFGLVAVLQVVSPMMSDTVYQDDSVERNPKEQVQVVTYSSVLNDFDALIVEEYYLDLGTGELRYFKKGDADNIYTCYVPNVSLFVGDIENYRTLYNSANPEKPLIVNYKKISDNTFLTFIPYLILIVLMIGTLFIFMRQSTGGGKMSQFSRANTRNQPANGKKITFADVAGADEEKQELEEIVDFMKNPKKYQELGARIPKGVLLVGPPGTGKTLLAKAVAGEANVPFFSISGSDFVEMFVGVGASRVRDLFDQAKKHTPSIIFIDEIDAVGRQRGAGLGGGHDEREQTLNQLLVEMDGFTDNQNIIVMAATNRRDILDPALLRPGRFDRQIVVNYPDIKGREEILKVHAKNKILGPDVDLNVIAKTTQYFTGADLENLLNEAALLAARNNRRAITEVDIEEATLKVIAGPEKKSHITTERDRRITAYHEAGHAVAAFYLPECERVHQVTTIQRGQAAGMTVCRPENDDNHVTKGKMYQDIVMTMGGRVAEAITFEDVCTGASGDIQQATKRARAMVTQYGFSDKLGPVLYGGDSDEVFLGKNYGHTAQYSDETLGLIDSEIKALITRAYEECKAILTDHKDKLTEVAEYLIEHEKISGDDFEKLMRGELVVETKSEEKTEEPIADIFADYNKNDDNSESNE